MCKYNLFINGKFNFGNYLIKLIEMVLLKYVGIKL